MRAAGEKRRRLGREDFGAARADVLVFVKHFYVPLGVDFAHSRASPPLFGGDGAQGVALELHLGIFELHVFADIEYVAAALPEHRAVFAGYARVGGAFFFASGGGYVHGYALKDLDEFFRGIPCPLLSVYFKLRRADEYVGISRHELFDGIHPRRRARYGGLQRAARAVLKEQQFEALNVYAGIALV